jgi:hypothetical protein
MPAGKPASPYQLQAAINAVHSDAPTAAETDWSQILARYDQLLTGTRPTTRPPDFLGFWPGSSRMPLSTPRASVSDRLGLGRRTVRAAGAACMKRSM